MGKKIFPKHPPGHTRDCRQIVCWQCVPARDFQERDRCARSIPSVDGCSQVGGELQLRVNAEQRTGRWRFRIEVADETVPGPDLDMTGGTVRAVDEHRPDRRGEWIAHQ